MERPAEHGAWGIVLALVLLAAGEGLAGLAAREIVACVRGPDPAALWSAAGMAGPAVGLLAQGLCLLWANLSD